MRYLSYHILPAIRYVLMALTPAPLRHPRMPPRAAHTLGGCTVPITSAECLQGAWECLKDGV